MRIIMFAGVYNKKTNIFQPCGVGEHWVEVKKIVEEEFGREACGNPSMYPVLDAWIAENIELIGNNAPMATYRFAKPVAVYA